MKRKQNDPPLSIGDLYPDEGKLLLTGNGKEFIERIGLDAVRQVVLGVLKGENIRSQTEPLTRRRIAQVNGAVIAMFLRGLNEVDGFLDKSGELAIKHLASSKRSSKAENWPAQWLIGLTDKAVQNVLRGSAAARKGYLSDFETAIDYSARQCAENYGDLCKLLGIEKKDADAAIVWKTAVLLATAIGASTLTIRGSDKSMYGKLFERLILGCVLSLLGFSYVDKSTSKKKAKIFWLSDSDDIREADATVVIEPGKVARFDIGFIGPGNPEISKDKLTRFSKEIELNGQAHFSRTFIVVDRLPKTGKTETSARLAQADIVQMSMQYWPRDLAKRLKEQMGYRHKLADLADSEVSNYLEEHLRKIAVDSFLQ